MLKYNWTDKIPENSWECPKCKSIQNKEKCSNCGNSYRYDQSVHQADTCTLVKELADRFDIGHGFLKSKIPNYENKTFYINRKNSVEKTIS